MDFKRALVRGLKGIFCKPIGRLFEAKRATIKNQDVKNYDKTIELLALLGLLGLLGSSGIWSDKLKRLYSPPLKA